MIKPEKKRSQTRRRQHHEKSRRLLRYRAPGGTYYSKIMTQHLMLPSCPRQHMIRAMATVHNPLTSLIWHFQETYRYDRLSLNPLCYVIISLSIIIFCICLQSMAEQLAENYHNTWGRKKKLELQSKGKYYFKEIT